MKNIAIIFVCIAMLVNVFLAQALPQKKENPHHGQMFMEQRGMEVERGLRPHFHRNHDEELLQEAQRLSPLKQLVRREAMFSEISSDTIYVTISILDEQWDTLMSGWVNSEKDTYTYDAKGNKTEKLTHYWNGIEWVLSWKSTYTYDVNGNGTEELFKYWNGSVWVSDRKYTYTYDANRRITEMLIQAWNGSAWDNNMKITYTYDVSGKPIEELDQMWNGSAWINYSKYVVTYDAKENPTQEMRQNWNGSTWMDSTKWTFTCDTSGNITEEILQNWNGSTWINSDKYTYTYNANGNFTGYIYQEWNSNAWVNNEKATYTHDTNGNGKEMLIQRWNGSAWANYRKYTITWQMLIIDDVKEQANVISGFSLSANYPNPFNPQTKIYFSVPKESYITLKIYDLLGREVATLAQEKKQQGEYSITWNAERVPSGVYYYRLVAVDPSLRSGQVFYETKKMVVMK